MQANSEHKREAAELIKLFLGEERQKTVWSAGYGESFWPVRKGLLPEIVNKYVNSCLAGVTNHSVTPYYFERPLSDEAVAQFQAIEDNITSACFPPPVEAGDILRDYCAGERDLDSAVAEIQQYMEKSLWAAS